MREGSSIGWGLRLLVVVAAITGLPNVTIGQACGNSATEGDEECDDGNTDGGDGCAANCTEETRHPCHFTQATLTFQADMGALQTPVRAVQILTIGRARPSDPSGEIPFVVRADDIAFDNQAFVQIALCSCVKAAPDAALGPGIVARGRIGCSGGLSPVDYTTTIDHNTHFNDPDPDPQCLDGSEEAAPQPHLGACNGPSRTTADVDGPTGSVTAVYSLTNYVFQTQQLCSSVGPGSPDRPQGADGEACTADDPQWRPSLLSATTGRVTNRLFHVRNSATAPPRERTETGTTVSCTELLQGSDPDRVLEGMVLVASANTELDAPVNDDIVATFRFVCSAAAPTATSTATGTPMLPTPTPTPTSTVTAASPTTEPTSTPPASTTPTATNTGGTGCSGDCDDNDQVRVDELVRGVNIALDRALLATCPSFDGNRDGFVRVNELVTGVNNLLKGCAE